MPQAVGLPLAYLYVQVGVYAQAVVPLLPSEDQCYDYFSLARTGLARPVGDTLDSLTEYVVSRWYRAPEIMLGLKVQHCTEFPFESRCYSR